MKITNLKPYTVKRLIYFKVDWTILFLMLPTVRSGKTISNKGRINYLFFCFIFMFSSTVTLVAYCGHYQNGFAPKYMTF